MGATEGFTGQSSGATATTTTAPTGGEIQNSAGELKVLAFDDDGATGNFYGQLTKGVAPLDNARLYDATDHTDYYTLSADATARAVSTPFVGVSTGSALIGAYGLGMVANDTAATDKFFDLANTEVNPPNTVTMTASGFISGDYVLVTEKDGSNLDINFTQMALNATLSATNVTTVSVAAIPSDTPLSAGTKGSIRIERDDGLYSLHRSLRSTLGRMTSPSRPRTSAAITPPPATTCSSAISTTWRPERQTRSSTSTRRIGTTSCGSVTVGRRRSRPRKRRAPWAPMEA